MFDLRAEAGERLAPVCSEELVDEVTARLGAGPVTWAVQIAAEKAQRHLFELPRLGTGRATRDTVRLGTELCTLRMLQSIAGGTVVLDPAPETVTMVREHVRRGVPLTTLLTSIRTGHAWLGEVFVQNCRRLVPLQLQPAALERISRILFEYVLGYTDEVSELYEGELQRWQVSADAVRDAAIRTILDSDVNEEIDTRASSHALGYDLHQTHRALVLRAPDDAVLEDGLAGLARRVLEGLGARSVLTTQVERDELWAWGGFTADPADDLIDSVDVASGVIAALGGPHRRIEGFRSSHLEARETADIAALSGDGGRVVQFDEVSLLSLLIGDQTRARAFMHRELGHLADKGENMQMLRETLLAYLACRRSPQTTAERLYVARNTVVYRVKRAEEIRGRTLSERTLELWSALLIARVLLR
ncbi:PucR family transcriptional regulator [Rhodococcus aetherivorans]